MNSPFVSLLSITLNPLVLLWNAWYWTRDRGKVIVGNRDQTTNTPPYTKDLVAHALMCLREHVPIPEMVHMTWAISNIPRALQEQMVRTRKAAFFCETMRVVDKSMFATLGEYFTPPDMEHNTNYDVAMEMAEKFYVQLRNQGVPPEHARGVLPMHVNTSLVMGLDLREFTKMMGNRTCWIAQGSYWQPIIGQFREHLLPYLGEEVCDYIFNPPCERTDPHCIMPDEAEHRLAGNSPYKPCPKYTEEIRAISLER